MNSASRYFPHAAAGFRSNPFRALTDAAWADCAVIGREIEAAYKQSESHIQLLGGMGAGKTTTLLGLQRLALDDGVRAVHEYLAEGQSQFTTAADAYDLLLLDETQRFSQSELARLLRHCSPSATLNGKRRAPRLAVASHRDLTAEFVARGLRLTTFSVDQLPPASWRAILDARLEAAARARRRRCRPSPECAQPTPAPRFRLVGLTPPLWRAAGRGVRSFLATGSDAPASGTA